MVVAAALVLALSVARPLSANHRPHIARSVRSPALPVRTHARARAVAMTTTDAASEAVDEIAPVACDWAGVDGGYMITCDASSVRVASAERIISAFGLSDLVQTRVFTADPEDKLRGCYMSHIAVLEEAERTFGSRDDWAVLVIEDNIGLSKAATKPEIAETLEGVLRYAQADRSWSMIHLAYIMYVPGLSVLRVPARDGAGVLEHVVQVKVTDIQSALGNTAYLISKRGVDAVLRVHREKGFTGTSIPDLMAMLFPDSRYAAYPMPFHRSAKIASIVNPQVRRGSTRAHAPITPERALTAHRHPAPRGRWRMQMNSFRQLVFRPVCTALFEQLLVTTGQPTSVLVPSAIVMLSLVALASLVNTAIDFWQLATAPEDFHGNVPLTVASALFSAACLAVIATGAALAPDPKKAPSEGEAAV